MTWCRPAPGSKPGVSMQRGRAGATLWGLCVLALAGWACESARNPGGFTPDLIKPTITLTATSGKSATVSEHLSFPSGSGAGGLIQIIGRATDGAGNVAEDTLFIFLVNLNAL